MAKINDDKIIYYHDMSLRDWFAGMALQGLLASASSTKWDSAIIQNFAAESFVVADAMLKEREKQNE